MLSVFATCPKLVEVANREYRQAIRPIVLAQRRLQGICRVLVSIVCNENQLLGLASLPDLQVA